MTMRSRTRPRDSGSKILPINLTNTLDFEAGHRKLFQANPREKSLDSPSTSLIQSMRHSLAIHNQMFSRILTATPRPSPLLAELLEDMANRYLDLSELALLACQANDQTKA